LLSLDTGKSELITKGFSYRPREVYSDPEFSPDGNEVLFAIHSSSSGDAVMAAGPFAILSLPSGAVRMLPSTVNIRGYGAAYGGSSRWSPNGREIFVDLDSTGKTLTDTSSWIPDADMSFAVDWMGNTCIVYIGGKDWNDAEQQPARVLSLMDHRTQLLATLRGAAPEQFANVVAVSPSIAVLKKRQEFIVQTTGGTWAIPDVNPRSALRLVPEAASASVPEKCR
jgi:hypothetical protein